MRRLIGLGVVLLMLLGVGAVALVSRPGVSDDGGGSVATAGERAAALDMPFEHFDGRVVRLSDWAGTPMVVNFWASWCPPCVAEMSAALEPVHAAIGDRVAFVGLNLQDDPESAAEIVERTGVTYELGRDPGGELFAAFGGIGMPTTVFLDETGTVVETHTGAFSRAQLEQLIGRAFGVAVP